MNNFLQRTAQATVSRPSFLPANYRILQRACACGQHAASSGRECEECKKKRQRAIQRSAVNNSPVHDVQPIVHEVLRSAGQPLDVETRAFMKPRFGHDFSNVPVHAAHTIAFTKGERSIADAGSRDAGVPSAVVSSPSATPAASRLPSKGARACVAKEEIPANQSGITALQGNVYDSFEVNIDWDNTKPGCDCQCGEYRQYVKGYMKVNGKKQPKPLWGGAILEENVFHEDGDASSRYGHRKDSGSRIDKFLPIENRAGGCSYRGTDTPGYEGTAGVLLDMALTFKGQTYDACRDTFGPNHEWKVEFKDIVP